jgi:hypothetical protein
MKENPYDMELWGSIYIDVGCTEVTRVPGGWVIIYRRDSGNSMCFIPFDNEFMETFK